MLGMSASAADDPVDPLSLQSASPEDATTRTAGNRKFVEGAVGTRSLRNGLPSETTARLSLDYSLGFKLDGQWRAALSDRLDVLDPPGLTNIHRTVNSLREAYVGWTTEDGATTFEAGRINLRNGPAYGYSPTDFLRAGTLRVVTSYDPVSLRENRLGTFMLRSQYSQGGQTFALALAPKLANRSGDGGFDLDVGSTNGANRALATWSSKFSDRVNTQVLIYNEQRRGTQLGASATALLTDSLVAYAEWVGARDGKLSSVLAPTPAAKIGAQRWSSGLTWALPAKASLTLEYGYNGFGLSEADWRAASVAGRDAIGQMLGSSQRRQEQFSREAWTVYATQQSALWRSLDLSALLRYNGSDRSHLGWIEARHHWPSLDVSVQWQWTRGQALSEYGLPDVKSSIQAFVTWYF